MDTDDLSTETYQAIIAEAEKFNHDLTLQFGEMASSCEDEKAYLMEAKELIMEIRKMDKDDLSDLFFGNPPAKNNLYQALDRILKNIAEVEKIPEESRHYDF